jgi:hypothetical protein
MKEQAQDYQEARADIDDQIESGDFAQYADQKVTSHDQSWSYVTDEQGRRHRIGSQEAADAAQTGYMKEIEAIGVGYGQDTEVTVDEDYPDYVDSELIRAKDEKIAELVAARSVRQASTVTGESLLGADSDNNDTNEDAKDNSKSDSNPQSGNNQESSSASEDESEDDEADTDDAVPVQRNLEPQDTEEETNKSIFKRIRNRVGLGIAAVTAITAIFGGIGASQETVDTEAPVATTQEVDEDNFLQESEESGVAVTGLGIVDSDATAEEKNTANDKNVVTTISIPTNEAGNGNVWDQVERAINSGDFLADADDRQTVVSQIVNAMQEEYGQLDIVQQGDTFDITQEILERAGVEASDIS